MSDYRDEREALRARVEVLEQSLVEKERVIAELRGEGSKAKRLDGPGSSPARIVTLVLFSATFAAGSWMYFSHQNEAAVPTAPAPTASGEAAAAFDATWRGKVKATHGVNLAVETPCEIKGSFSQTDGKLENNGLRVVCGTVPLYDASEVFSGTSTRTFSLHDEPDPEAMTVYRTLYYQDVGPRTGRNQVEIDTNRRKAMVWLPAGDYVEITTDEHDRDGVHANAPLGPFACPHGSALSAQVVSETGKPSVAPGALCVITLRPATDTQCGVRIECGGETIYGEGSSVATKNGSRLEDDQFSVADRDPKLVLDLDARTAKVWDEAVTAWSVELRLDSPPR
jgi:hypothetical protein